MALTDWHEWQTIQSDSAGGLDSAQRGFCARSPTPLSDTSSLGTNVGSSGAIETWEWKAETSADVTSIGILESKRSGAAVYANAIRG